MKAAIYYQVSTVDQDEQRISFQKPGKYLILCVAVILVFVSTLLIGCGEFERDEAVVFYRALNLIYSGVMDNMGEWNEWSRSAPQSEFDRDVQKRCTKYENAFNDLHDNLVNLTPPDKLDNLKATLIKATEEATNTFAMMRRYAYSGDETYFDEALQSLNKYNELMIVSAKQWDDGLTHYNIDLSEIVR